ncbi:hypothetical protein J6590_098586 [Homalodisca vitripennis]|nr:hypothetical protein J6590_098586 [Homalodisca vitripennis]
MSHNQPTGKRDRSDRSAARQGLRARQSPGDPWQGGVAASGRLVRGGQTRPALITARVHPGMVHQSKNSRNPIDPDKGRSTKSPYGSKYSPWPFSEIGSKISSDADGLPVFNSTLTPKRTPQFAVGPPMPKSSAVIRVQAQSVNHVGALHRCRSGQKGTWRALAGVMMYPYACS